MKAKPLSNKDILQELIDKIKGIKRITQGKISLLAGYESENYLSEAKSTDSVTDNIVKAVALLYEKAKVNPSILDDGNIIATPAFAGEEVGKLIVKNLEFKAFINIILPAFADISAKFQEKEFSTVYNGLRRAIEVEFEELKKSLKGLEP